jgi:hypothetical protein
LPVARQLDWLASLDPDSWMAELSSIGSEREEGLFTKKAGNTTNQRHYQHHGQLATIVPTAGCGFSFFLIFHRRRCCCYGYDW